MDTVWPIRQEWFRDIKSYSPATGRRGEAGHAA
jgi:hypothetical protein